MVEGWVDPVSGDTLMRLRRPVPVVPGLTPEELDALAERIVPLPDGTMWAAYGPDS
jgi:hypothetical protein